MRLDGRRRSVRLGAITKRDAENVKRYVERLVSAKSAGVEPDQETAAWVGKIATSLVQKLARLGLVPERAADAAASKPEVVTLGAFLKDYFQRRDDVKPATVEVWGHTQRNLLEHFGGTRTLDSITKGDADDFKRYLLRQERERPWPSVCSSRPRSSGMRCGEN